MSSKSQGMAPIVEIEKLSTVFRSAGQDFVVHQDLGLRIEAGVLLSIVGGSGSGKTVLLRQMLGLERPHRPRHGAGSARSAPGRCRGRQPRGHAV